MEALPKERAVRRDSMIQILLLPLLASLTCLKIRLNDNVVAAAWRNFKQTFHVHCGSEMKKDENHDGSNSMNTHTHTHHVIINSLHHNKWEM